MDDLKPLVPVKADEDGKKVMMQTHVHVTSSDAEGRGKKKADDPVARQNAPSAFKGKGQKKPSEPLVQGTTPNATSSTSKWKIQKKARTTPNATSSTSKGKKKQKASITPIATVSAAIDEGNTPIWFTLIASKNQNTNAPLKQIPTRYLRVKDRNLKVSYIKKYIVMKLGLESEDEVELFLNDLPLDSSTMLYELLQYWIVTHQIPERAETRAGTSGAEFVMVLYYGCRTQPLT